MLRARPGAYTGFSQRGEERFYEFGNDAHFLSPPPLELVYTPPLRENYHYNLFNQEMSGSGGGINPFTPLVYAYVQDALLL